MSEEILMLNGGVQTISTTAAIASPQLVYLDFDGAVTSYHNRDLDIAIDNIVVENPAFGDDDIAAIVASLNARFDDVVFFISIHKNDDEFRDAVIKILAGK